MGPPSRMRRGLIAWWLKLRPPTCDVVAEQDLVVPMPDGSVLYADHYEPKGSGKFPTVLIRSPWGRTWKQAPFSIVYLFIAQRFAERGYHVVLNDMRNASGDANAILRSVDTRLGA